MPILLHYSSLDASYTKHIQNIYIKKEEGTVLTCGEKKSVMACSEIKACLHYNSLGIVLPLQQFNRET